MYVGTPYPPRLVDSPPDFYRICRRGGGALATLACLAAAAALAARAASDPSLSTSRGCYVVGQAVQLRGSGFAPRRTYVVTVEGVYFGKRQTDGQGGFAIAVYPGGLPKGAAQHVDRLEVSDGSSAATTTFTLTRRPGARVTDISGGSPQTLTGRFQVWGYAMRGVPRAVYVHYVDPAGRARRTVRLGTAGGQCGYLHTGRRRVFPLALYAGVWTLQVDTRRSYRRRRGGPVTRILVRITG